MNAITNITADTQREREVMNYVYWSLVWTIRNKSSAEHNCMDWRRCPAAGNRNTVINAIVDRINHGMPKDCQTDECPKEVLDAVFPIVDGIMRDADKIQAHIDRTNAAYEAIKARSPDGRRIAPVSIDETIREFLQQDRDAATLAAVEAAAASVEDITVIKAPAYDEAEVIKELAGCDIHRLLPENETLRICEAVVTAWAMGKGATVTEESLKRMAKGIMEAVHKDQELYVAYQGALAAVEDEHPIDMDSEPTMSDICNRIANIEDLLKAANAYGKAINEDHVNEHLRLVDVRNVIEEWGDGRYLSGKVIRGDDFEHELDRTFSDGYGAERIAEGLGGVYPIFDWESTAKRIMERNDSSEYFAFYWDDEQYVFCNE